MSDNYPDGVNPEDIDEMIDKETRNSMIEFLSKITSYCYSRPSCWDCELSQWCNRQYPPRNFNLSLLYNEKGEQCGADTSERARMKNRLSKL